MRYVLIQGFPCTMLQKFSKYEVKAAWCVNLPILVSLKFYVKSNFGAIRISENIILTVLDNLYFEF